MVFGVIQNIIIPQHQEVQFCHTFDVGALMQWQAVEQQSNIGFLHLHSLWLALGTGVLGRFGNPEAYLMNQRGPLRSCSNGFKSGCFFFLVAHCKSHFVKLHRCLCDVHWISASL